MGVSVGNVPFGPAVDNLIVSRHRIVLLMTIVMTSHGHVRTVAVYRLHPSVSLTETAKMNLHANWANAWKLSQTAKMIPIVQVKMRSALTVAALRLHRLRFVSRTTSAREKKSVETVNVFVRRVIIMTIVARSTGSANSASRVPV